MLLSLVAVLASQCTAYASASGCAQYSVWRTHQTRRSGPARASAAGSAPRRSPHPPPTAPAAAAAGPLGRLHSTGRHHKVEVVMQISALLPVTAVGARSISSRAHGMHAQHTVYHFLRQQFTAALHVKACGFIPVEPSRSMPPACMHAHTHRCVPKARQASSTGARLGCGWQRPRGGCRATRTPG